jgi:hypothetical protein
MASIKLHKAQHLAHWIRSMADGPDSSNSDFEKHLATGGALATFLTGLGAPFTTTYKSVGYSFFAISSILLLVIAVIRLNKSLSKKRHILPLVVCLVVLCIGVLGLDAWSIQHPAPSPPLGGQTVERPGPPIVNNTVNTTNDRNSPISTGDGATVIINDDGQHPTTKPNAQTKRR